MGDQMSEHLASLIYLVYKCRLIAQAREKNLGKRLVKGHLREARHQLDIAIKKNQGLHHEFQ